MSKQTNARIALLPETPGRQAQLRLNAAGARNLMQALQVLLASNDDLAIPLCNDGVNTEFLDINLASDNELLPAQCGEYSSL